MSNENIEKDYAIEQVRTACRHFADLYFYFSKVLTDELGGDKTKEILEKVLFERSIERAERMREKAKSNNLELVPDNIIKLTDVPFLGWVPELKESHCPYGEAWISRLDENPWFKELASLYCDVTDTTVAEEFTGNTSHKITQNVLWGDKSCERIYFPKEELLKGEYTYGKKENK
ncbi:hypothetical protein AXY43_05060 [Clostridium sp. MF28]|uniref:L-2-amino-thiazoline-4-carboxylic acid hydrolase n=1 Tax=Clostridium TaxID=1485 RepID=UPI000CF9E6CC|nr:MULTISPECIES: L-2-amino-thiazoline-4-carboxylic acid hydrolase [Clostridium]AVK47444.1 hypothetical protein AXY43_05060 [Clostridium sp. MF28]NOW82726.1 hypothetical protein [Clostridium beijerinckii]PSM57197.1 hypothetical protein C4L39_13340 [Clostridium diolis]